MARNDMLSLGRQTPQDRQGEYNQFAYIVRQLLLQVQTATLVRVVSCTNDGGLSPVGYVDVIPMVHQVDGNGDPTPHGQLHNLPYFRIQGGKNAVIIDPEPGDIGMAAFASRDISAVKTTKSDGNPGSYRTHNFGDGMYFGGFLNATPEQYAQFSKDGIKLHSPKAIVLEAPTVTVNASESCTIQTPQNSVISDTHTVNATTKITQASPLVDLDGALVQGQGEYGGDAIMEGPLHVIKKITSDTDVFGAGTSLHTHVHSGVMSGSGDTGPPV